VSNPNVSALSRVYSNFQVLPDSSGNLPNIQLPTVTLNGGQVVYGFNVDVAPGIIYHLDPQVATGYIYETGAGNPNFASVSFPDIGNPNAYQLYLWDSSTSSFVFDTLLNSNTFYQFAQGGVSKFEVLGIDPTLGLDPLNATAFITDVTFVSAGNFNGTMIPITATVPEPVTLTLFGLGLAVLGASRRRLSK
jgi:hypothetical protein